MILLCELLLTQSETTPAGTSEWFMRGVGTGHANSLTRNGAGSMEKRIVVWSDLAPVRRS